MTRVRDTYKEQWEELAVAHPRLWKAYDRRALGAAAAHRQRIDSIRAKM